jgi:hypothetical protein
MGKMSFFELNNTKHGIKLTNLKILNVCLDMSIPSANLLGENFFNINKNITRLLFCSLCQSVPKYHYRARVCIRS